MFSKPAAAAHVSISMPCRTPMRCCAKVDSEQALRWALAGGEGYELCFTVPELNRGALDVALGHLGARFTCIGQIAPESERAAVYPRR